MGKIIFDGVDVSECCSLDKNKKCNGQYDCENEVCAYKYNLLLDEMNRIKSLNRSLKKDLNEALEQLSFVRTLNSVLDIELQNLKMVRIRTNGHNRTKVSRI